MPKIKRLTALRIEQIFTIIIFLTFVFFIRNTVIEFFNRQVDLNTEKTIIISKKKYDNKLLEIFDKRSKNDFSTQVDLLILYMLLFFLIFINIQRRINKEKERSLLTENPTAKA
jgi:predicted permease